MQVVRLLEPGLPRVLNGRIGMTFIVDSFTDAENGRVAHVRDYRYNTAMFNYQVWSISPDGYKEITK